jgi:S-adenosylmethionine hydrolase
VIHIDRFGNAITNLVLADVPRNPVFLVQGVHIYGVTATYQESELAAIIGSTGRVEIAVRNGSAARDLGIQVGGRVSVRSA